MIKLRKNSDEEYLYWQKKFYSGNLMTPGWDDQKKKALSGLTSQEQNHASGILDKLGTLICLEWAKDNNIRKIDNQDLYAIGTRLKKAKLQGFEALCGEIENILSEIDQKLATDQ